MRLKGSRNGMPEIQEAREALARGELPALFETRPTLLGQPGRPCLDRTQPLDEREHSGAVYAEVFLRGVDLRPEDAQRLLPGSRDSPRGTDLPLRFTMPGGQIRN